MPLNSARILINALALLGLVTSFLVRQPLVSLVLSTVCLLLAVGVLYCNLRPLSALDAGSPKLRVLRTVSVFNVLVLLACLVMGVLQATGKVILTETGERIFAGAIVTALILFTGNLAPMMPFTRHTGLRLPWTVADERTWLVAHRILGYLSLPLALLYLGGAAVVPSFEALTLTVILLWVGIPGALSYVYYRKRLNGTL